MYVDRYEWLVNTTTVHVHNNGKLAKHVKYGAFE